jgi:hypothetical protein
MGIALRDCRNSQSGRLAPRQTANTFTGLGQYLLTSLGIGIEESAPPAPPRYFASGLWTAAEFEEVLHNIRRVICLLPHHDLEIPANLGSVRLFT